MSESGFASLGPSLLARKGGARPAMRPQLAPLVESAASPAAIPEDKLEDLGWNDMGHDGGHDAAGAESGAVVPLSATLTPEQLAASPSPIVVRQQRRLAQRVLADAVMTGPEDRDPDAEEWDEDEGSEGFEGDEGDGPFAAEAAPHRPAPPVAPAQRRPRGAALAAGRRAAFTLRLDAERHLKLRLAATVQGVSAQALVTEALDRLLAEYGALDAIASQLKRN